MALSEQEELELLNIEIAMREKSQKPTSPLKAAVQQGIKATPGIGQAVGMSQEINKLPPEAQKALLVTGGAEIGLLGGPMASGAMAALAGGATEAAQNPATASKVISPILKTAINPTPQSVLETIQQVTTPEAKNFMKRRAVEAGTAAASGAALKAVRGVQAEGPFTAGMNKPGLVFKKTREKILEELGMAKNAARVGENAQEAGRLRRMLAIGQAGKVKLAEEAIEGLQKGSKMTNTQLLAYEEALGKVQSKGVLTLKLGLSAILSRSFNRSHTT